MLGDTIQPFPSFSGIYDTAVKALAMAIADKPLPPGPMDAQMANLSKRAGYPTAARPSRKVALVSFCGYDVATGT